MKEDDDSMKCEYCKLPPLLNYKRQFYSTIQFHVFLQ